MAKLFNHSTGQTAVKDFELIIRNRVYTGSNMSHEINCALTPEVPLEVVSW